MRNFLQMNPCQGSYPKVLFICTGGILRSATCAHWAVHHKGCNTRSCGTMLEAVPHVSQTLLDWADRIYCLEEEHKEYVLSIFGDEYEGNIKVLGIPDEFAYRDPKLISTIKKALRDE